MKIQMILYFVFKQAAHYLSLNCNESDNNLGLWLGLTKIYINSFGYYVWLTITYWNIFANPKCTKHFLKRMLVEIFRKYSFFTQKLSFSIFCMHFFILDHKIKRIRNLILPTRTNFCPHNCEFE